MELEKLSEQFKNFCVTEWDALPDIELYMDQVTAYLNKLLKPQLPGEDAALISASMVHNYVKHGHITPPEKKKYKKEQLAALYMLCSVKQALAIPDAAVLLEVLTAAGGQEAAYSRFVAMQRTAFAETAEKIKAFFKKNPKAVHDDAALAELALLLALQSTCHRIAAERIIALLAAKQADTTKHSGKKEQSGKKD